MTAKKAQQGDDHTVQNGITVPGAHGLPAWVADVDGSGESATEETRRQSGDTIGQEGGLGRVAVAPRLGAFQVLERANNIEEAHGKNDRQVFPA